MLSASSSASKIGEVEESSTALPPPYPPPDFSETLRPKVWVKIRPPTNYQDSVIKINPDGKLLELNPRNNNQNEYPLSKYSKPPLRSFFSDGILQNSSHEETFQVVAEEIIERAMNGVSGVILSLGPEGSGKSFDFYGDLTKYEGRGLLPRSFEKIFEYAAVRNNEVNYSVWMGMFEIRRGVIRDLITLSPKEIKTVSDNGPNGMFLQEIKCPEHGLALLIRAITGQKLMHQEQYSKYYHTMVYIDIHGEILAEVGGLYPPLKFNSRITFAKIASIPPRVKELMSTPSLNWQAAIARRNDNVIRDDDCLFITPIPPTPIQLRPRTAQSRGSTGVTEATMELESRGKEKLSCCSVKDGYIGETISVRRDFLYLEQMFIRVSELQKLHHYYQKLSFVGMQGIMRKPNLAPSQYFRQSKLCHCLRELVCCNNEVRVLVHIRPEAHHLPTVIEALRFVECLRQIQPNIKLDELYTEDKITDLNTLRAEIAILREELEKVSKCTDALTEDTMQLSPSQTRLLHIQAVDFLEGKIDQLEIETKAEAKALFGNLRELAHSGTKKGAKKVASKAKGRKGSQNLEFVDSEVGIEKSSKHKSMISKKSKRRMSKFKASETKMDSTTGLDERDGFPDESKGSDQKIIGSSTGIDILSKTMIPQFIDTPVNLLATKSEALIEFEKLENGSLLAQELKNQESKLQEITSKYSDDVRYASELVRDISSHQVEFQALQQERHINGDEYDPMTGNVLVSKREKDLFNTIQNMKKNLESMTESVKQVKIAVHNQKRLVDSAKVEFDAQFQLFYLERYPEAQAAQAVYEVSVTADQVETPADEHREFCNLFGLQGKEKINEGTGGIPKDFEILKRMAQAQAKAILKYYQTKPAWRN